MAASTLTGRNRKLCIHSLASLTTIDTFECLSDSASEGETCSEDGTLSNARSEGPEPSDTVVDSDVDASLDDGSDADSKVLASLGFLDDGPELEPLLTPCRADGTAALGFGDVNAAPPSYPDLFWRSYLAAQEVPGKLTFTSLAEHNAAHNGRAGSAISAASAPSVGNWLGHFKLEARKVPLKHLTSRMLGDDVGVDVAGFLGDEGGCSSSERCESSVDRDDHICGGRVIGSRLKRLRVPGAYGRSGFLSEDEVSISTPDRGSPPHSGRASECSDEVGPPHLESLGPLGLWTSTEEGAFAGTL